MGMRKQVRMEREQDLGVALDKRLEARDVGQFNLALIGEASTVAEARDAVINDVYQELDRVEEYIAHLKQSAGGLAVEVGQTKAVDEGSPLGTYEPQRFEMNEEGLLERAAKVIEARSVALRQLRAELEHAMEYQNILKETLGTLTMGQNEEQRLVARAMR